MTLLLDPDRVLLFALVLARATGLVIAAPLLGDGVVPARVRALLAVALAVAMLGLAPIVPERPDGPVALALAVGGDLVIGFALGFAARLVVVAFRMAGQLVGIPAGLGIAQLFDPANRDVASPLGRLLWIVGMALFLALGGHHQVLRAVAESLRAVPPGQGVVTAGLVEAIVRLTGDCLVTALRLAAPALGVLLLVALGLGLLSRSLPTMNPLFVGVPVQVAAGLVVIVLTLPFALELARHEIAELVERLSTLVAAA